MELNPFRVEFSPWSILEGIFSPRGLGEEPSSCHWSPAGSFLETANGCYPWENTDFPVTVFLITRGVNSPKASKNLPFLLPWQILSQALLTLGAASIVFSYSVYLLWIFQPFFCCSSTSISWCWKYCVCVIFIGNVMFYDLRAL